MAESAGRREANKQAVRGALLAAARQLFAERGFEETTVRDIARAAGVTERTFYRYFDGKEGLIDGDFQAWLGVLHDSIAERPPAESPVLAVQRAMISVGEQLGRAAGPLSMWMYRGGPAPSTLRKYTPRPLLQLEDTIADAVLMRAGAPAASTPDNGTALAFRARVISRVCVAAMRSALIEYRQQSRSGAGEPEEPLDLLAAAFAIIDTEHRADLSEPSGTGR
jgi:AcrR family transcriptional regulator